MINTKKQTNDETDNNLPVSKYLRSFIKKIVNSTTLKTLGIMLMLMFLNIGAKSPVLSESIATSNNGDVETVFSAEAEKYMKMYEEIYEKSLIQQIEFESEILIPDYIDFKYVEYIYKISTEAGIPIRVMFRLVFKESTFNIEVSSPVGAEGLMQLMPATRKLFYSRLRVDTLNLDRVQEDIYIGAYYIKDLNEYWRKRGNSEKTLLKLSIAAYNSGLVPVMKYKGVPPFKETQDFVMFILKPHSNPVFYSNILKKNTKKDIT